MSTPEAENTTANTTTSAGRANRTTAATAASAVAPRRSAAELAGEHGSTTIADLVVEYGVAIPDLAAAVRGNVISAVERICGLEVTEVNVNVDDIHLPGEQDADAGEPRVQ